MELQQISIQTIFKVSYIFMFSQDLNFYLVFIHRVQFAQTM